MAHQAAGNQNNSCLTHFVDVIFTCTPKFVNANFMVPYQLPSVYMMFTFYSDEEDFLEDDFLDTLLL